MRKVRYGLAVLFAAVLLLAVGGGAFAGAGLPAVLRAPDCTETPGGPPPSISTPDIPIVPTPDKPPVEVTLPPEDTPTSPPPATSTDVPPTAPPVRAEPTPTVPAELTPYPGPGETPTVGAPPTGEPSPYPGPGGTPEKHGHPTVTLTRTVAPVETLPVTGGGPGGSLELTVVGIVVCLGVAFLARMVRRATG